jgi:hypothetical protein
MPYNVTYVLALPAGIASPRRVLGKDADRYKLGCFFAVDKRMDNLV